MAEFYATYKIDDKGVVQGLKSIESAASSHQGKMKSTASTIGQSFGKQFTSIGNIGRTSFAAVGIAVGLVTAATRAYAKENEWAASSLASIDRSMDKVTNTVGALGAQMAGVLAPALDYVVGKYKKLQDLLSGGAATELDKDAAYAALKTKIGAADQTAAVMLASLSGEAAGLRGDTVGAAAIAADVEQNRQLKETVELRNLLKKSDVEDQRAKADSIEALIKQNAERKKQNAIDAERNKIVEAQNKLNEESAKKYDAIAEANAKGLADIDSAVIAKQLQAARLAGLERESAVLENVVDLRRTLAEIDSNEALSAEQKASARGRLISAFYNVSGLLGAPMPGEGATRSIVGGVQSGFAGLDSLVQQSRGSTSTQAVELSQRQAGLLKEIRDAVAMLSKQFQAGAYFQ